MKRNFLERALDKVIEADLKKEKTIEFRKKQFDQDLNEDAVAYKEEREVEYAEAYQHPSE